jgi:hypothetical protein
LKSSLRQSPTTKDRTTEDSGQVPAAPEPARKLHPRYVDLAGLQPAAQHQHAVTSRAAYGNQAVLRMLHARGGGGPGLLQRKCACGGTPSLSGECPTCRARRLQQQAALQTKLIVGPPGDQYEQEADRIARQVMHMPEAPTTSVRVGRHSGVAGAQAVQASGAPMPSGPALELEARMNASQGGGRALPEATRSSMEAAFGVDFSGVRVHTDSVASQMNRELGAHAFTYGSDIYFGAGKFDTSSAEGKGLLAHELTHVVQQNNAALAIQRRPAIVEASESQIKQYVILSADRSEQENIAMLKQIDPGVKRLLILAGNKLKVYDDSNKLLKAFTLKDDVELPHHYYYLMDNLFYLVALDQDYTVVLMSKPADPTAKQKKQLEELNKRFVIDNWFTNEADRGVFYTVVGQEQASLASSGGAKQTQSSAAEGKGPTLSYSYPDWFKELKQKIEAILAQERSANKDNPRLPDEIFFYGSDKVQAQKGADAWTIEVEKGKREAYLTIRKETWDAAADKDAFAKETVEQLYAKVQLMIDERELQEQEQKDIASIYGTGQKQKGSQWAWAFNLKRQIEALLAAQKAKEPAATDFPLKLTLTTQADQAATEVYLRVSVYKETSDAQPTDTPELAGGTVPSPLGKQDKAADWVPVVRQMSAALKSNRVTTNPAEDTKEPTQPVDPTLPQGAETILAPYPATIYPRDMNENLTTASIASNTFRMVIHLDAAHGTNLLNLATIRMGMHVSYTWNVYQLPEKLKAIKTRQDTDKVTLFKELETYVKENRTNLGDAVESYAPDYDWDQSIDMSSIGTGDFMLVAHAGVRYPEEWNIKRATSIAALPFSVKTAEELARGSVYAESDVINDLKQELAGERDAKKAEALRQRLQELEARDKEELLSRTTSDINETKALLAAALVLKRFIEDDRKQKIPFAGNATYDPFLIRLKAFDNKAYAVYLLVRQMFSYGYDDLYAVNEYIKLLTQQENELSRLQKRTRATTGNSNLQHGSPLYRTVTALVRKDDGNVIPLILVVGRHKDTLIDQADKSKSTYKMMLFDVTFDSPSKDDMVYVGDEATTEQAAIASAFDVFGEQNKYGDGQIVYRVPQLDCGGSAESVMPLSEYLEYALAAVGIALLVGGTMVSGGALAPATAAAVGGVISALGIASAVAGAALAARNIYRRVEKGTFELDAGFALDVVSIIGASVQMVGTAGKLAAAGRGVSAAARAMQIQRLDRLLFIYDAVELTGNVALVSLKVEQDLNAVKALNLPPEHEDQLIQQITMEAVQTGAILAYASFSKIKDVSDHIAARVEKSRYKTFNEKGWVDANGKPTDQAPPSFKKQTIEPGTLPDIVQQGQQAAKEAQVLPLGKYPSSEAGHQITITERGRIIRCSDFCSDLRMKYAEVLALDPYLEKEMVDLEARAKGVAATKDKAAADLVASDTAKLEAILKEVDDLRKHLFGASEQEWDEAIEAMSSPQLTGGPKSGYRVDGKKVSKRARRVIDVTDFMTEAELKGLGKGGYKKTTDRINQVMGKKISDMLELAPHWEKAAREAMGNKTPEELGREKMIKLYKSTQRKFWSNVRQDPAAVAFLKQHGFVFEGKSGAALAELGPLGKQPTKRGTITDQERRISLDHIAEKAQGENWKKSLAADNLELMFQNANSWKEIVQVKFGMRDQDE